jgi:hypothetical protein
MIMIAHKDSGGSIDTLFIVLSFALIAGGIRISYTSILDSRNSECSESQTLVVPGTCIVIVKTFFSEACPTMRL